MNALRRALLWLALFGLLSTSGLVCSRVAERGRYVGAYSSYGAGPAGTRALYLLAERLGGAPRRWAEDLAALPEGSGMLVALGGCESGMARELSRYERRELSRWVEGGGTLLVAGARHYLPDGLGVDFESEPRCQPEMRFLTLPGEPAEHPADGTADGTTDDDARAIEELQREASDSRPSEGDDVQRAPDAQAGDVREFVSPEDAQGTLDTQDAVEPNGPAATVGAGGDPAPNLDLDALQQRNDGELLWAVPDGDLAGLGWIPLRDPGRLRIDERVAPKVILSLDDAPDMPLSPVRREAGVVVAHGRGHVIVLASASPLQNGAMRTAEGGVLFARLLAAYAPHGPVLFDEYHLGVGERRSMMRYLRQAGMGPVALQLLLLVLLVLLRAGRRFGGVLEAAPPPPAGTASFVSGMGNLFARARDAHGAAEILVRQALTRIARHHHLQPAAAPELQRQLRTRGQPHAAEAVREIASLSGGPLTELSSPELPGLVRKLDALVAQALSPAGPADAAPGEAPNAVPAGY